MAERNITRRAVRFVVERHVPHEMYGAFEYPHGATQYTNAHPVFSVTGQDMNGRWITVAVAVMKRAEKLRFKIVTVIVVDEKSRHRNG